MLRLITLFGAVLCALPVASATQENPMTPAQMSAFNIVLAGLAGEQADPDDLLRFKADVLAPAYLVGNGGKIPSFKYGPSVGQHRGGQSYRSPAETSEPPDMVAIAALSSAEKRRVVIDHMEAMSLFASENLSPDEILAMAKGAYIAKADRELRAYNEKALDSFLRSGWNSGVSAALADGARFDDADASCRDKLVQLCEGVEADTLIVDQITDQYIRKHPDFRTALPDGAVKAVDGDALLTILSADLKTLKQYVVLDAQDDAAVPRNPICGATSGFAWAGRLAPSAPRTAGTARPALLSHNIAFLRGFHGIANPALKFGARLNNRVNTTANGQLSATMVMILQQNQLQTEAMVVATGKFSQVNNMFGGVLTNTWVA